MVPFFGCTKGVESSSICLLIVPSDGLYLLVDLRPVFYSWVVEFFEFKYQICHLLPVLLAYFSLCFCLSVCLSFYFLAELYVLCMEREREEHAWGRTCHAGCGEVKGQLCGVHSLLFMGVLAMELRLPGLCGNTFTHEPSWWSKSFGRWNEWLTMQIIWE